MAKRKNKKAAKAKENKAAQKKFFMWTILITLVMLVFMYMFFKNSMA